MSSKIEITQALVVTAEILGTELSEAALSVMANDLAAHPEADVIAALVRCRREIKYRLTLADILERLPDDISPAAVPINIDAAWDMAVRLLGSLTEDQTVVVPEAIMQSWPSAIWEAGDKVGARMAFRAVFPDRRNSLRCGEKWIASLGQNRGGREAPLLEARMDGRLSPEQVRQLIGYDPASDEADRIAA